MAKLKAQEDGKMQNDFDANKNLFWKWVHKTRKGSSDNELIGIKNTDGDMIWDTNKLKDCVKAFFENFYECEAIQHNNYDKEEAILDKSSECDEVEISMLSIKAVVQNFRSDKGAGADTITSEMLKNGDEYRF